MPKLTAQKPDTYYINLKPKEKDYRIADGNGLNLLIRKQKFDAQGKKIKSRKTWQCRYRLNGKENTYTIGDYSPKLKAGDARRVAMDIKDMVKQGLDPNQQKKVEQLNNISESEHTFEKVAREWHERGTWKEAHKRNILSRLEKDVFPIIGTIPIAEIKPMNIALIGENIANRGATDVAKRICQYCERIFDDAITLGLTDTNPAIGKSKRIQGKKTVNRKHLNADQLQDFIKVLNNEPIHLQNALMAKLHTLTFVRPVEIREATWGEFDFEKKEWHKSAEDMKKERDFIIPLSPTAISILKTLKQLNGDKKHLFPGIKAKEPICDATYIKYIKKLTGTKATPHGFRHTASTILHEKGFRKEVIEKQLSHEDKNKVAATYNKAEYMEERREMLNYWAEYLNLNH